MVVEDPRAPVTADVAAVMYWPRGFVELGNVPDRR
jgi:hypothetical protein